MASIMPRNGKYAVVTYVGDDRRPVWKSGLTYTQATKLKARKDEEEKKWREEKKQERKESKSLKTKIAGYNAGENPSNATVAEYMEEFISIYATKHWGDSYHTTAGSRLVNYVYPHFGHYKIVDVTTQMIDDFYDFLIKKCEPVANRGSSKKRGVSAALVKDIHKILRTAFNQAKRWKLIKQNPFLDADVPEYKSKERPAFSPGDFEKVLDYTDDDSDYERYTIHVALCVQYYCTTRGGEVGALQWQDYNPKAKTLHIFKTIDRVSKKNLDLPKLKIYYRFPVLSPNNKTVAVLKQNKTEATERFSRLNNIMLEKLDRLKDMQEELIDSVFGDCYQNNKMIICQPNGRPLLPEQLNRKFKAIIIEMRENGYEFSSIPEKQIDDVVFHSVRAVSATKKMQVSKGNIKAVMKAGGWAEPDMVIRYSKTYDEDQIDIVNQMEADHLKAGNGIPSTDTERLLRAILDNPELLTKLIASVPDHFSLAELRV